MSANSSNLLRVASFDLELAKEIPSGATPEVLNSLRPYGISCAAIQLATVNIETRQISYHPVDMLYGCCNSDDLSSQSAAAMSWKNCEVAVHKLVGYQNAGYIPLTWNGAFFDFDVLAEESGLYQTVHALSWNHIDMMVHFATIKGFRLGIEAAHKGLGYKGKLEGMHGEFAPIMWAGNNERLLELERQDLAAMSLVEKRQMCLSYVHQDTVMAVEVFAASLVNKGFTWISKKGRANRFDLPDNWMTVAECSMRPVPAHSWMETPLTWPSLVGWMAVEPQDNVPSSGII